MNSTLSAAKKTTRTHLAIALCVALIMGIIGLPMAGKAASAAAPAIQISEPDLPTGDLYEMECYEASNEEAEKVPSYDDGIATMSDDQSFLEDASGDYGYNSLTEGEQAFYNVLKTSFLNFLSAGENFTEITFSGGTTGRISFKVNYEECGITLEQAIHVDSALRADCPWIFWAGGSAHTNTELMPTVKTNFSGTLADVRNINATIESGTQSYITAVSGTEDTYEKVRIIHDKIVDAVNYAYKEDGTTPQDAYWAHSVVGVFDSSYNAVVCEGYAKTFSLLLNILDIPNIYIVGMTGDDCHAWNAVSFDNGETYYYVDVTWDDHGGYENALAANTYIYFAMPKTKFETDHIPFTTAGTDYEWQYDMPNLGNEMDYTYFVRYAAYAQDNTITDENSALEFIKGARTLATGENCLMLFPDNDSALQAVVNALLVIPSYSLQSTYQMRLVSMKAENCYPATPATAFAFSQPTLKVGNATPAQTLEITSVTADSDDYITFSSSDEAVARVKTPYVKAKDGKSIEITVRKAGKATIHAKAAKGTGTASCEITVAEGAIETEKPTATPEVTPSPTPSATPSPTPSVTPSPTPSTTPSPTPSAIPSPTPMCSSSSPSPTPAADPGVTPSPTPSQAPSADPGVTPSPIPSASPAADPGDTPSSRPSVSPSANPDDTPSPTHSASPSTNPGVIPLPIPSATPSANPGTIPSPRPSASPSANPDMTTSPIPSQAPSAHPSLTPSLVPNMTATPTAKPTSQPARSPKPSEAPVKKGSKVTDKKTKAIYTVTETGKTKTVKYCGSQKKAKSLAIPATVKINGTTYKVTSIGAKAFAKNASLQKITIGKNVKTIGIKAFYECKKLKKITMGENVTSIAREAFYNCTALTEITIPAKITKIGAFAFYNCQKLKSITIETKKLTTKKIGSDAFYRIGSRNYKKLITEVPLGKLSAYTKLLRKRGYSPKAVIMPSGGNMEAYLPAPDPVELSKDTISLKIDESQEDAENGTATIKLKKQKGIQLKMVTYALKKQGIVSVSIKGSNNIILKVKAKKAGSTKVILSVKYKQGRKIKTKKLTLDVEVETLSD